ncbi:pyridoxamine 5'-phosphate oxidase family protein [Rhizobium sp. 16-449-1b]|uniref:pyridoxamine 5'-phosphate oxidase family protein n=1 Tax=Rhizobium sp. 16-449-1b TaxID=2819989 RepID=UPI001AD9F59E|nr:pyridoxamine 5'-phosphate oxidase family protein [Rhizobium sp. 16-449-1b]MBO9198437.1 pyridoxamine 5'-phosphate oxidase family protein [Rhizobium sp. 16-449-1b]
MSLPELDEAAWIDLELAGTDPNSGFRYVNLCTVDPDGHPQARLVVLRSANGQKRTIEIHTDTRSDKWREIGANPSVTLLAFDPARGQQLRLRGTAERHGPGSPVAADAWDRLSPWTRSTYAGGPPTGERSDAANAGDESGKVVFGVIVFRASELDWFQLERGANRRALFSYGSRGELRDAREINP